MKDRIHIISYPGPDRSITDSALKNNNIIARKYKNRRIGEFLKELKLTEGRNTGIPKIKRALEKNGSRPPIFETNADRDYFLVTLFIHDGFNNIINISDFESINASDKTSDKTSDKLLLYLVKNESITTDTTSNLLNLSKPRTRAILHDMALKNIIYPEGANKNRVYKIRKKA